MFWYLSWRYNVQRTPNGIIVAFEPRKPETVMLNTLGWTVPKRKGMTCRVKLSSTFIGSNRIESYEGRIAVKRPVIQHPESERFFGITILEDCQSREKGKSPSSAPHEIIDIKKAIAARRRAPRDQQRYQGHAAVLSSLLVSNGSMRTAEPDEVQRCYQQGLKMAPQITSSAFA
ncbi:hypothetical protein DL769_002414 [Monosporascus sp. CRB-8-3]|nr:hypothetical protein DL769_002414 [Monosporascus sp. CRB-8-3]